MNIPYVIDNQSHQLAAILNAIPHDRCPLCWGEWDCKLDKTSCPSCGVSLGMKVKLLLDSDVCPDCERGTVCRENPSYDDCGFTIDPDVVVWG